MLNIINNLPEALVLADLPDCLKLLHFAYYNLSLCPELSFTIGRGSARLNVGDELTTNSRWWARRPGGDRQRMFPFPGFRRPTLRTSYLGRDGYFEIEVIIPRPNDGRYSHCPRTLMYQPGCEVDRNTLSALRIHGLTTANITELKHHLGWH
jgi:hypothetical protein